MSNLYSTHTFYECDRGPHKILAGRSRVTVHGLKPKRWSLQWRDCELENFDNVIRLPAEAESLLFSKESEQYIVYLQMLIQLVRGKPLSMLMRLEREGNYIHSMSRLRISGVTFYLSHMSSWLAQSSFFILLHSCLINSLSN